MLPRRLLLPGVLLIAFNWATFGLSQTSSLPPGVRNDQDPRDKTISPAEARQRITVPDGFSVRLLAGEPDVAQPIAADWDDRGRLWVVECYSHPIRQPTGHDRILIFEDTDNDGAFDKRQVFWDEGQYLTGILYGHGGVWICNTPCLMFIPDGNRDDVPDGPPEIHLDGWYKGPHNVLNNLTWAPDGWMYGCIGNDAMSVVGKPGAPRAERTEISRGIWRYHPRRHEFEVVALGAVNPWGIDFDDWGEGFFTNCVLGHLWHLIPGAYYQRRGFESDNPYAYTRIQPIADHLHWGSGAWTSSRGGTGVHDTAGGGHAHTGAMIYLGDNWPDAYRNTFFTGNLHGNRINNDLLVRKGSGYVGRHAPDFLYGNHDWFRCLWQTYGPDGGVFIGDWHDFGECHDKDGTHRTSGRIYKIVYGESRRPKAFDLAAATDAELVAYQSHTNDWFVRHARRLLQERADAGADLSEVRTRLLSMFHRERHVPHKLRALWALLAINGLTDEFLIQQLKHENEHIRAWCVRLLSDLGPGPEEIPREALRRFAEMAEGEASSRVRLYLAAALQRIPVERRWDLAVRLSARAEDANDPSLPHMIWYGAAPLWDTDPDRALRMLTRAKIPLVRQHMARRTAQLDKLVELIELLGQSKDPGFQRDLLRGMDAALRGRKDLSPPDRWDDVYAELSASPNVEVRDLSIHLALQFRDPTAIASLRATMMDPQSPVGARRASLRALADNRVPGLSLSLQKLLAEEAMRKSALQGLAAYDDVSTPEVVLARYHEFDAGTKDEAVNALASRPRFAMELLHAIENGTIHRRDVSASTARQLANLGDKQILEKLRDVWGIVRIADDDKRARIADYKAMLSPEFLKQANLSNGRSVFNRTCMKCHRLFGEGGTIGQDLTGSNRANLDYVLENVLDPSAVVGQDFRITIVATADGRILSGLLVERTASRIVLQTVEQRVLIPSEDIEEIRESNTSIMPEGQLENLHPNEVRDLVGYLASPNQVPLKDF